MCVWKLGCGFWKLRWQVLHVLFYKVVEMFGMILEKQTDELYLLQLRRKFVMLNFVALFICGSGVKFRFLCLLFLAQPLNLSASSEYKICFQFAYVWWTPLVWQMWFNRPLTLYFWVACWLLAVSQATTTVRIMIRFHIPTSVPTVTGTLHFVTVMVSIRDGIYCLKYILNIYSSNRWFIYFQ